MAVLIGIEKETMKFSTMISDACYNRIYNDQVTSIEFVFVAHCANDLLMIPFTSESFHKWHLGTFAVVLDILSVLVVYYVFNKLKEINLEYQEIMDNNIIKMSKFAIRINDLLLDKTTQDARILKMKVWLHFSKILEPFASEENTMEVADVQISNPNANKFFLLMKM